MAASQDAMAVPGSSQRLRAFNDPDDDEIERAEALENQREEELREIMEAQYAEEMAWTEMVAPL